MNATRFLEKFFRNYPIQNLRPDTVIVEPGAALPYVYFLKSGLVRQYNISRSGDLFLVNYHRPGAIFPLSAAFQHETSHHFYDTFQPTRLYRAPVEEFTTFIKAHPEILYHFSSRLLDVMEHLNTRLRILTVGRSPDRLALFLIHMSRTFGKQINGRTIIDLPLTHRDIANWIGTTRETVSWQMLTLKQHGLIQYSHHQISILDLPRLQETGNSA